MKSLWKIFVRIVYHLMYVRSLKYDFAAQRRLQQKKKET